MGKETFEPNGNWILVRPKASQTTIGDTLHIADDAVKKNQLGEVVHRANMIEYENGDTVFFQQHGAVTLNVNQEDLLLINKAQILGRFL